MEHQTRFDLNTALANWRQELAAQPELVDEDRRELETHLRGVIAELQQRGLNEEESFWLARRRLGQPPQIAEEFAKADPVAFWRERILWIAVGAVASYELATSQDFLSSLLDPFGARGEMGLHFILFAIPGLALAAVTLMIRRGHANRLTRHFSEMPRSPRWFASLLFVLLMLTNLAAWIGSGGIRFPGKETPTIGDIYRIWDQNNMRQMWFFSAAWPALMVSLVFLLPRARPRKRVLPKTV